MELVTEKKAAEKTKGDKCERSLCKSSLQSFEGRNQPQALGTEKGKTLCSDFAVCPAGERGKWL